MVAVSGAQYTVDVLAGDFELNESLTLYRDDGYDQKDCVGKGTIVRRDRCRCRETAAWRRCMCRRGSR